MILAPLQKLPMNVGDLGKFIVAKGFKIANSGHTGHTIEGRYFHRARKINR